MFAVIYHHMDILGDILLVRLCDVSHIPPLDILGDILLVRLCVGSHIPPYGYTR